MQIQQLQTLFVCRLLILKSFFHFQLKLIEQFQSKNLPTLPVGAKFLMEKYQIPEGKSLGTKLKIIEEEWVNNNFTLSENQIHKILSR